MSVAALTAAYDSLGHALFTRIAETPGNIVLSPLSIGTAMAMTLSGTRGDTEAEMIRVLGHHIPRNEIEAASAALVTSLQDYGRRDAVQIAIANALMLDEELGNGILPSYRALVRDCYAAEVMAGAKAADVNAWVADKTMGLVPRLLDTVDADIVALILNAIAFAANWACPFDSRDTQPGPFTLIDGGVVSVPMMRQWLYAAVADRSECRAIRLPFVPSHLALLCVVPHESADLDAIGASLDPKRLFESNMSFVELTLPKFRLAASFDLVPPLQQVGLRLAMSDSADFGGMADPEPGVKIGQVRHGAFIEVHEDGCAAAAATAVEMVAAGAIPPKPEPFVVDRPFLYYLLDDRTGAMLMRGRVVDPRE